MSSPFPLDRHGDQLRLGFRAQRDVAVPAPGLGELEVFVPKGARLLLHYRVATPRG